MLLDISPPKLLTSLSTSPSNRFSAPLTPKHKKLSSSSETQLPEELPELALSLSSTLLISPEPDSPPISEKPEKDNSPDQLTASKKYSKLKDYSVFIKDSGSPLPELSPTEPCISEDMTLENHYFSKILEKSPFGKNSSSPNASPLPPELPHILLIPLEEDL